MVPILKMRRFSCLLRLSLPPEMGEIAQTFMSEIEWLAALKCRAKLLHCKVTIHDRALVPQSENRFKQTETITLMASFFRFQMCR